MANIPPLSSSIPAAILKPLQALKRAVENVVTTSDLTNAGIDLTKPHGGIVVTPTPTYAIPNAITGLTATGAFASILLGWDDPSTQADYAYTNVYRASVDDVGVAVKIGESTAPLFSDTPPNSSTSVTYYYWVRGVNKGGIEGPYNQTAGTAGSTATDPAYAMELLAGQITANELTGILNSRINLIDAPATGLIDSLAQEAADRAAAVTANANAITQEVTDRAAAATTNANAIAQEAADRAAAIMAEANARVGADTIIQSDITTLQADSASNSAAITAESVARASADSAMAANITTLQSDVVTANANISSNATDILAANSNIAANTGAITANSTAITTLENAIIGGATSTGNALAITALDTRVTANEGNITTNATDITSLDTRITTNEGTNAGQATAISALQTDVTANTSGVTAKLSRNYCHTKRRCRQYSGNNVRGNDQIKRRQRNGRGHFNVTG